MKQFHSLLTRLVITENVLNLLFSNNQPCKNRGQGFWLKKGTEGLQYHKFLIFDGNSIIKIFGSVDNKITPDFCSKSNCLSL